MSTSDFFKSALAASDGGVIRPMKKPMTTDEDIRAFTLQEKILENMCGMGKRLDPAYADDIWEEIERIIGIVDKRERMDAIEDLTLMDILEKAAECRVKAMIERGDFQ